MANGMGTLKYTVHSFKGIKVRAKITVYMRYSWVFRVRLNIGVALLKLAARVLGCEMEVTTKHNPG